MKKNYSIIIIKNDEGKYLQYYDERWKSWLFPNCRVDNENDKEAIKEYIKQTLKKEEIACQFLFDKIHTKFSQSDKIEKEYHHYFFKVQLDSKEIQEPNYKYFSYEELLANERIREVNSDIIEMIKNCEAKQTLLFSNIEWNKENSRFNKFMEEYLTKTIKPKSNLVFINAPGLGEEETYLPSIISCFKNINITFSNILDIEENTPYEEITSFLITKENIIYFLMGGNPLTQYEIIKKNNLINILKDYEGLVIGFCTGAINLSKYAIITTDEDFDHPQSYDGINRVNLIIEPHYNKNEKNIDMTNRNQEILNFSRQYNMPISAIPDTAIVVIENEKVHEYGEIEHFNAN